MSERKINSSIINKIREQRDPKEHNKIRNAMHQSAIIQNELKCRGISKGDFAIMMDKKPSVISKWLSGTQNLTTETLSEIEIVLGIQLLVKTTPPKNAMVPVKMDSFERIRIVAERRPNIIKSKGVGKVVLFTGNSKLESANYNYL